MNEQKKYPVLTRMETDMKLRGLAINTQESYLRYARKFLDYCSKTIDEIDEVDAKSYLIYLMQERRISEGTINQINSAIRFLFSATLNRTVNYLQLPRFKKKKVLPVLLSRDEIKMILNNCINTKHKAFYYLAYGSGLRISEIATLRVKDIDSKSMRVFVNRGKGGKDRYTILSDECLCVLRDYWSIYRPKSPGGWLFLGVDKNTHITTAAIANSLEKWIEKLKIEKPVSMHSFRHAFATHLLEDGASIFQIKELLGHASLSSTTVYLHLANNSKGLMSPADRMFLNA